MISRGHSNPDHSMIHPVPARLSPLRAARGGSDPPSPRALPEGPPRAVTPRAAPSRPVPGRASLSPPAASSPLFRLPRRRRRRSPEAVMPCPVIQEADEPLPPAFPSGAALRGRGEGGGGRRGGGTAAAAAPTPGPARPVQPPAVFPWSRAGGGAGADDPARSWTPPRRRRAGRSPP